MEATAAAALKVSVSNVSPLMGDFDGGPFLTGDLLVERVWMGRVSESVDTGSLKIDVHPDWMDPLMTWAAARLINPFGHTRKAVLEEALTEMLRDEWEESDHGE